LPGGADGTVAQQVSKEPCECQRAKALMRALHGESPIPCEQLITGLIGARLVDRRLGTGEDAVLSQHELVRPDPAPVRAENLVIRCAGEAPPVLKHERHALALTLNHHLILDGHHETAPGVGAEYPGAPCERHALDAARSAVREQYRRTLRQARSTTITHETETDSREIIEHAGLREIIGHD